MLACFCALVVNSLLLLSQLYQPSATDIRAQLFPSSNVVGQGILQAFSTRLGLLRNTALWSEQLPDSQSPSYRQPSLYYPISTMQGNLVSLFWDMYPFSWFSSSRELWLIQCQINKGYEVSRWHGCGNPSRLGNVTYGLRQRTLLCLMNKKYQH